MPRLRCAARSSRCVTPGSQHPRQAHQLAGQRIGGHQPLLAVVERDTLAAVVQHGLLDAGAPLCLLARIHQLRHVGDGDDEAAVGHGVEGHVEHPAIGPAALEAARPGAVAGKAALHVALLPLRIAGLLEPGAAAQHLLVGLADHLLGGGEAAGGGGDAVGGDDPVVRPIERDRVARGIQRGGQGPCLCLRRLPRIHQLRHVRNGDDEAPVRRRVGGDVAHAAVAEAALVADRLRAVDGQHLAHEPLVVLAEILARLAGDDLLVGLADHLLDAGEARELQVDPVGGDDPVVGPVEDDGVARGVERRGQRGGLGLRLLARRDQLRHVRDGDDVAAVRRGVGHHVHHRAVAAAALVAGGLRAVDAAEPRGALGRLLRRDALDPALARHDLLVRQPDHRLAVRKVRDPGGDVVGGDDAALGVEQRDALARGVQGGGQHLGTALHLALGDDAGGDVGQREDEAAAGDRARHHLQLGAVGAAAAHVPGPLPVGVDGVADVALGLLRGAELAGRGLHGHDLGMQHAGPEGVADAHHLAAEGVGRQQPVLGVEQRDAVAHVVQHRLHHGRAGGGFLLRVGQRGDVGEAADPAAARDGIGPDLDDGAVGPAPRVVAGGPPRIQPPRQPEGLRILRRTELALRGLHAQEVVDRGAGDEALQRQAGELGGQVVGDEQAAVIVVEDDAVAHVVEHGLQRGGAARRLGLGRDLRGDVGIAADEAAVRKLVGDDLDRRALVAAAAVAVGPVQLAAAPACEEARRRLAAAMDAVGDLQLAQLVERDPRDELLRRHAAEMRGQAVGDDDGALRVEHRDAVAGALDHGREELRALAQLGLGGLQRGDVGHHHGVTAIGQRHAAVRGGDARYALLEAVGRGDEGEAAAHLLLGIGDRAELALDRAAQQDVAQVLAHLDGAVRHDPVVGRVHHGAGAVGRVDGDAHGQRLHQRVVQRDAAAGVLLGRVLLADIGDLGEPAAVGHELVLEAQRAAVGPRALHPPGEAPGIGRHARDHALGRLGIELAGLVLALDDLGHADARGQQARVEADELRVGRVAQGQPVVGVVLRDAGAEAREHFGGRARLDLRRLARLHVVGDVGDGQNAAAARQRRQPQLQRAARHVAQQAAMGAPGIELQHLAQALLGIAGAERAVEGEPAQHLALLRADGQVRRVHAQQRQHLGIDEEEPALLGEAHQRDRQRGQRLGAGVLDLAGAHAPGSRSAGSPAMGSRSACQAQSPAASTPAASAWCAVPSAGGTTCSSVTMPSAYCAATAPAMTSTARRAKPSGSRRQAAMAAPIIASPVSVASRRWLNCTAAILAVRLRQTGSSWR
jgi:hypothetical protein